MAIIRWNPYSEVETFTDEILNRLASEALASTALVEEGLWSNGFSLIVDIFEDADKYLLTAELPGLDREDVEVKVLDDRLSITGERKLEFGDKMEGYQHMESCHGSFSRSFTLPHTVDITKVEAKMEKGILRVTLPKKEETKPKQIEVKVN